MHVEREVTTPKEDVFVDLFWPEAGDEAGVDVDSEVVLMEERHGTEEFDVILRNLDVFELLQRMQRASVLCDRLLASIFGNQPRQIAEVEAVEEHLLVVATKRDDVGILGLEANDLVDNFADAIAAVDQVAEEDELVGCEVPRNVPHELFELVVSAVNVADHVGTHGIYDLAVQGRAVRSGLVLLGDSFGISPRQTH
jgi:hypothetical protein